MYGDNSNVYTGDPGSKHEDVIQNLNNMKRRIIDDFKTTLQLLIDESI